jgi:hypothetical protein
MRFACLPIVLAALAAPAAAGPVLDDILNTMFIDQSLSRSGDDFLTVEPDRPLGQTFVTGEQTVLVCRIALRVAYWHESWQPGESLVVSLWDSLGKRTDLGRFAIPYERRQWHDALLMFAVEAKVEPKREYYLELTVDGGDGRLHGILLAKADPDYSSGTAYQGGKPLGRDLWFETYVKKPVDRDANFAEFFGNLDLDLPSLAEVRTAVAARDWDTACREFLAQLEGRQDLMNEEDATPGLRPPRYDQRESDLVAEQKWLAQDGSVVDLGPDWNYHATWPTLGGVGLTRTGLMKPLAWAYSATGDPKYARAWNAMLISLFRNVPSPLKSGVIRSEGRIGPTVPAGLSGSLWDSISLAARLHHETFYNRFRKSPLFEPDVRLAWWANVADMANCLERMDAGGNWTTQNTSSLFSLGQKYPEFRKSKDWFALGFDGLKRNLLENLFPDGPCREAANYHVFSLGMFFDVIRRGREQGLPVSAEHLDRLEKAFSYTVYTTQPDGSMTLWGDSNRPADATGLILQGGRYFARPDMIWVGTKGQEGTRPTRDSIAFTQAGYFIMRSGWDPEARFLVTRNGLSESHYHHDQLSVQVQAYGSDLLPDMGVYTYGTPECNELVRTISHSTVGVDGKDILAGNGESQWAALPGFDYFDGTSPGYNGLPGVRHRRRILFVKPDYWVFADSVSGEGDHTSRQYWHFAPGKLAVDQGTGAVRTTNATGGNLAVVPVGAAAPEPEISEGLYAIGWEKCGTSPVATFTRRGAFPHRFMTVLYPQPAGRPAQARAVSLSAAEPALQAARVLSDESADYIVFCEPSRGASLPAAGLALTAQAALVRTNPTSGKVTAFAWFDGVSLSLGGVPLATSPTPVRALSVRLDGQTVRIDTEGPAPGLSASGLGATQAVLNGEPVALAADATSILLR